jgi:hypothetical protein
MIIIAVFGASSASRKDRWTDRGLKTRLIKAFGPNRPELFHWLIFAHFRSRFKPATIVW